VVRQHVVSPLLATRPLVHQVCAVYLARSFEAPVFNARARRLVTEGLLIAIGSNYTELKISIPCLDKDDRRTASPLHISCT
jgi:hypothetical protein